MGFVTSPQLARHNALEYNTTDLPMVSPYTLDPGQPPPGRHTLLRPPLAVIRSTGMLTGFPSATLIKPRLRGRLNLRGLAWRRKPWVYGERVSRSFLVTYVSILSSDTSTTPLGMASQAYRMLPYHMRLASQTHIRSFGVSFKPRYIFGAGTLDQ